MLSAANMEEAVQLSDTVPSPDECAALILRYSGYASEPHVAFDLWPRIQQHKWFLSEKLNRDVGMKVACVDLIENVDGLLEKSDEVRRLEILQALGAQRVDPAVWETIADSQPPKQIVSKRIVLPLTFPDLAHKHGVMPPRAIMFFGPPGTGKTHFVRGMAGALKWWYVEVSPSVLMADGEDRVGANLKKLMETVRDLENAVVFIDEFEEIAGNRDQASRIDKSITNEFLKQVPLLKRHPRDNLLVCATNYIGQLDAALLRPGRFDCVIPVGGLDDMTRKTIVKHYLARMNRGEVDVDRLTEMLPIFTPADIEYLFQRVAQVAFEQEYVEGNDYRVTTDTFLEMIPTIRPTLNEDIIASFERDCAEYTRY